MTTHTCRYGDTKILSRGRRQLSPRSASLLTYHLIRLFCRILPKRRSPVIAAENRRRSPNSHAETTPEVSPKRLRRQNRSELLPTDLTMPPGQSSEAREPGDNRRCRIIGEEISIR